MDKALVADRSSPLPHSRSLPYVTVPEYGGSVVWSQRIANLLMIVALALISTLPLVSWLTDMHWHDQQRIGQILTLALVVIIAMLIFGFGGLRPPLLLGRTTRHLIMLVVVAAGVSACFAHQPVWAFTELALGVASLGLAWLVASVRRLYSAHDTPARERLIKPSNVITRSVGDVVIQRSGSRLTGLLHSFGIRKNGINQPFSGRMVDRVLLATLFFICAGLVTRFAVCYLAAMVGDADVLDAWLLIDGFSNPRFFGQFLTLALPLLAVPLLTEGNLRRYALVASVLIVLVWTAAIVSGTRGTWLGLTCAAAILACIGPIGRRWTVLHIAAACIGVVLTWVMMTVIPATLDMSVAHHAASKLNTSLSLRDIIWTQAIKEALSHPLLGIGPMQLAGLPNGVAAHPHQAWLQWAAELGLPSALLVTWLVILTSAVALLSFVAVRDYPNLDQREEIYAETFGDHLQPRFWSQGVIAIDVNEFIKSNKEGSN